MSQEDVEAKGMTARGKRQVGLEMQAKYHKGQYAENLYQTPTATSYGTNQGGASGRVGPVRPSLSTWARSPQDQWETGHRFLIFSRQVNILLHLQRWLKQQSVALSDLPSMEETGASVEKPQKEWLYTLRVICSMPRLSPPFVSWLMGFPWWWTRAEPISCAAAEMRSYLSRLRSLLESF